MAQIANILIFSENRETKGTYMSLVNLFEATASYKEKSKNALQSIMGETYDIIIIEIMQPLMSEIEFVDHVYDLLPDSNIIIISSYFYDTMDIVFGDKIKSFLPKPIELDRLHETCKAVFESSQVGKTITEVVAKPEVGSYETKKLSVLLEISRSLNSIVDFDELLHRIVSLAAETLQAERATLFIVDKRKSELWSRSGIGIEKQEIRIPMDKGIAGEVAISGEAQIIDDPYSNSKFNKEVDIKTGFTTRNILCLPMKNVEGSVIGVFQILNKIDGSFTKEDQFFLGAMAVNTGIAIENALLHDEMKRQLIEVKGAYDDLYIAQNQILKEAKFVTHSEIVGHFKNIFAHNQIEPALDELQELHSTDPRIDHIAGSIRTDFTNLLKEIDAFLEDKKKELQLR